MVVDCRNLHVPSCAHLVVTYLCLLDESGRQVRPEGWFLYGACAIESDQIWALHRKIVRIRNRAGFRSRTPFKWTRPTAQSISAAAHNRAADELLDACREEAVRMFIAMVPSVLTLSLIHISEPTRP